MTYMDTEYDTRPWNPPEDVVKLDQAASHQVIKEQLDTEVLIISRLRLNVKM